MSQTKANVVFFAPYGSWLIHNQLEAIVGTTLRIRGANVLVIQCDGVFRDRCYVLGLRNDPNDCAGCAATGKAFYESFGLSTVQLGRFVTAEDVTEFVTWLESLRPEEYPTAEYQGLPVGKWATPSVCSHHTVNTRALGGPTVQETHKRYLLYALLAHRAVSRVFDQVSPTHLVEFSGRTFLHSPVFDLARSRDIQVVTHEIGYTINSYVVAENDSVVSMNPRKSVIHSWRDVPLERESCERITRLLEDWEVGKNRPQALFYRFATDERNLRRILGIPHDAKIFGVFGSSEYESVYIDEWKVIERQLDTIDTLMEIFEGREEYLVIRHHPNVSEIKNGTADYEYLRRAYIQAARAPRNVRIIMPHEQITGYALLWNLDACVAFLSTVGLEAAARLVPSASLDVSTYEDAMEMTLKDFTRPGLERLTRNLFQKKSYFGIPDLARAYRLLYALCYRYSQSFRSFEAQAGGGHAITVQSIEELAPGNDPYLDRVCNHILEGSLLHPVPSLEDIHRDGEPERRYLAERLASVLDHRKAIADSAALLAPLREPVAVVVTGSSDEPKSWVQRYDACEFLRLELPSSMEPRARLEAIEASIAMRDESFVAVMPGDLQYDGAYLSTAMLTLENETDSDGVLAGAWYIADNELVGQCFTRKEPEARLEDLLEFLSVRDRPENVLGLCLMRRDAMLRVLRGAIESEDEGSAVLSLLAAVRSSNVKQLLVPLVLSSSLR